MEEAEDDIRLETAADREARRLADAYSNSDNIPAPQVGLPLPLTPAPYPALTILSAFCRFAQSLFTMSMYWHCKTQFLVPSLSCAVILDVQEVIAVIHKAKADSLGLDTA